MLSARERQALETLSQGPSKPGLLFRNSQAQEEAAFMGDWSFFSLLKSLHRSSKPLIEIETDAVTKPGNKDWPAFAASLIALSDDGRRVLEGNLEYGPHRSDGWIWGRAHHLGQPMWRWDPGNRELQFN